MWNVAGSSNINDITCYVNKLDILFLLETWDSKASISISSLGNHGFELYTSPARKAALKGRAKGGLLCIVNPIIYKPKNICIKEDFICIRIKICNQYVIVCAVYFSPSQEIESLKIIKKIRGNIKLL